MNHNDNNWVSHFDAQELQESECCYIREVGGCVLDDPEPEGNGITGTEQ